MRDHAVRMKKTKFEKSSRVGRIEFFMHDTFQSVSVGSTWSAWERTTGDTRSASDQYKLNAGTEMYEHQNLNDQL